MTADMPAARILIVEAETTIARFVSDALKEEGFTVFIEGTLKEGLTACSTRQPDLVVVDLGLPDGDGLKTINVKVRDDVGNETAAVSDTITLNTSIPAVTITGPDKSRISKVTGYDAAAFSFVCDVDFEEYTIRVVPATSSLHTAGTQIPTTGGSTNVSGTAGGYKKNTAINVTVKGADLESASSGDGVKIVKVFVKNAAGTWSAA